MSVVRCGVCKNYIKKEDAVRTNLQSFCEGCVTTAQKRPVSKKRKANTPDELRDSVLRLDGKCRFCGVRDDRPLHVHHVYYRSEQGPHEQSNLVSLHMGCHDEVHANKAKYQRLCLGVIWLRSFGDKHVTVKKLERMGV